MVATPAGWTQVGTRLSSTDTETILYSKVAAANDAGRSQAVDFTATTKATLTVLAYDGTDDSAAGPIAVFASAAETTNRATHTTPGANVATAGSYVVSYWADKSSATTGWTLPAGQTQRALALGTGPGRITSVASDLNAAAPVGASPGRTATADASHGQGDHVDRRPPARPGRQPERRPGRVVHHELPDRDLHGRRLGLHRHRARHRGVVRLGLRRRRHGHRCVHHAHLHDQRQQDDHADRHGQPGR